MQQFSGFPFLWGQKQLYSTKKSLNPWKTGSGKAIGCKRTSRLALSLGILSFDLHQTFHVHSRREIRDSLTAWSGRVWKSPKPRHRAGAGTGVKRSRWEVSRTTWGGPRRKRPGSPKVRVGKAGEALLTGTVQELWAVSVDSSTQSLSLRLGAQQDKQTWADNSKQLPSRKKEGGGDFYVPNALWPGLPGDF